MAIKNLLWIFNAKEADYAVKRTYLLQKISSTSILENLHLLNGNLIEFYQSLRLRHSIIDKHSVEEVPPFAPVLQTIPTALVSSTHRVGSIVKAFEPASIKRGANSTPLKLGCVVIQTAISILTAIATALGVTSCMAGV